MAGKRIPSSVLHREGRIRVGYRSLFRWCKGKNVKMRGGLISEVDLRKSSLSLGSSKGRVKVTSDIAKRHYGLVS